MHEAFIFPIAILVIFTVSGIATLIIYNNRKNRIKREARKRMEFSGHSIVSMNPMVSMNNQMVSMNNQMVSMNNPMASMNNPMVSMNNQMVVNPSYSQGDQQISNTNVNNDPPSYTEYEANGSNQEGLNQQGLNNQIQMQGLNNDGFVSPIMTMTPYNGSDLNLCPISSSSSSSLPPSLNSRRHPNNEMFMSPALLPQSAVSAASSRDLGHMRFDGGEPKDDMTKKDLDTADIPPLTPPSGPTPVPRESVVFTSSNRY